MIEITEVKYLEETGDVDIVTQYPSANDYYVDSSGNLTVTIAATNSGGAPKVVAFYPRGSFRKLTSK